MCVCVCVCVWCGVVSDVVCLSWASLVLNVLYVLYSLLCLVPPPPLSAFHDTPVTLNCHCFVVLQTGYVEEEADS